MNIQCSHLSNPDSFTKSLQQKKIYKDQCVRCFHLPSDNDGLYICMKCFNSFCKKDMVAHNRDHKHVIYTQFIQKAKQNQQKPIQITKLAIGKQGGGVGGVEYESSYQIYCFECKSTNLENKKIIEGQLQSLINTQSPFKKQSFVAWEVDILPCEHTLTLQQFPINKDLQKCVNCQLSTNLWLCLTCGNTGCGRKNFDGTGGNSHGINHFEKTAHPLVVKLGTITAEGQASIYCYACNNDVKDQLLRDHLGVLGINIAVQKKTEKTVTEINLQINLNFTLSKLVEGGNNQSKPIYGKDYTGMNNIGNSCYLNSVIQSLNSLQQFRQLYYIEGQKHIQNCKRIPSECFYCQVAKVAVGLNSGQYSQKLTKKMIINSQQMVQEYQRAISPFDFKLLIAGNNKQFLSNHQQDALQYLQYLLTRLEKQQPNYNQGKPIWNLFNYIQANKQICMKCNGYKQIENNNNEWRFPVRQPTKKDIQAHNQKLLLEADPQLRKSKELQDPQYDVSFDECITSLKQGSMLESFCPNCKANTQFLSKWYFKSTPKYLLSIANRFVEQNWVPKKLNALLKFDSDKIDVSPFLINNSKEGGFELKEQASKTKYSQQNVDMLVDIGYHRNAAIRALIAQNDNIELACNWIMENMDKNLEAPIQQASNSSFKVDQNALTSIMQMQFSQVQAKVALTKYKNNIEEALEWLFNNGGDVSEFTHLLNAPKKQKKIDIKIEHTQYELQAVIVHLGKSVHSGHYVCFIKKNNEWTLFNDEKVSIPSKAVIGKGYLYLFRGL